jgi:2-keto-4-pentenoate hydratase
MVSQETISALALRLREAETTGVPIPPIRDLLADGGVDAAYAVQSANTDYHIAQGRRLVGRKIGLTSKAVQKQLGVDSPDFGALFADMEIADEEEIAFARTLQPKVEAEIALVLEKDLAKEQMGLADVISALAYALPAIEVVGSRIENWNIRLLDTVADNASSGLFVLGGQPVKIDRLDWREAKMSMRKGETEVSTGSTAACLGNPLIAALWLARTMVSVGSPLRAGDLIMTGALGPMAAAAQGDVFESRIDGLGSVRAVFGS